MHCKIEKATHARLKYTSIDDIVPQYYVPEPKRNRGDPQHQKQSSNSKMESRPAPSPRSGPPLKLSQTPVNFKYFNEESAVQKKCKVLSKIFEYLFCESEVNRKKTSASKKKPDAKNSVYMGWETEQILKQIQDTNLGDFILKLPNPDAMPPTLDPENNQHMENLISLSDASILYDQMFNTEDESNKVLANYEQQAFELSFYLLDIRGSMTKPDLDQHIQKVNQFLTEFRYFITVSDFDVVKYMEMRNSQSFQENESIISNSFYRKEIRAIKNAIDSSKSFEELTAIFEAFKRNIFQRLNGILLGSQDRHTRRYMNSEFIVCLFLKAPSISSIFRYFPDFFNQFLVEVKGSNKYCRKYCNGGSMVKVAHQNHMQWVLQEPRPQDVLTLLRRITIYKLTRRGGLFVRSFLSQNENYIFLVIKSSQKHLQSMAQKKKFCMELQFGAIDIFAFEPIDRHKRPLRCNKYIRDASFQDKYNLKLNKQDKDQTCAQKSIQSQAVTLYVRAQEMNEQELRAKIILDQQQCDDMYHWVSKTLSVHFVNSEQVVFNQYNAEQIDPRTWPIYYVYNKLVIEGIYRLRQTFTSKQTNNDILLNLKKNIGLILRLLFLKAQWVCNDLYRHHRNTSARGLKNIIQDTRILHNLWDSLSKDSPRGYWPYFYSSKYDFMWRKYEINESKDRSKFTSASRTIITNEIIKELINIDTAINERLVSDYFPIHDPYLLKNIRVKPYLQVFEKLVSEQGMKAAPVDCENPLRDMFIEYECEYTQEDFMKNSVYEKLSFRFREPTQFSANTVAFYCGEKLAFFFEFRRFLVEKVMRWAIVAFIIQIVLWIQISQIYESATSSIEIFGHVLITLLTIFNLVWVDRTIASWEARQISLSRAFGTTTLSKKPTKRILFRGIMQRNLETDQVNFQTLPKSLSVARSVLTFMFNTAFVVFMGSTLLLIFVLKGYLYQQGYSQSTVTQIPAILIAISVLVFNFLYSLTIKAVVDFENKKTLQQYESSLSSKNFVITFIVSYFALYIYGFFSTYFSSSNICLVKTESGVEIQNCYLYLSNQLITSSIVDLLTTIFIAFLPFGMFKAAAYFKKRDSKESLVNFNQNYFESIDQFYEEQDQMSTYMYTDDVDSTWIQYTKIVISFSTVILFGPIVPFLYTMMFIAGLISLHSKKFEIIYFSKRALPVKADSIGSWLIIVKIVSILGVFTNLALVVYVRGVFQQNQSVVYIASLFVVLFFKYLVTFLPCKPDTVGRRSKVKAQELILDRALLVFDPSSKIVNTDIENLYYDEEQLKRRLPKLHRANAKKKA